MSEVKWIKIVTDIFDDEKIQLIESLPEADSIIVIWFKLLCLAGKNNNSGVFTLNDRIHYTDEMFATIFRRHVNVVKLALTTFENFGMIELINDVVTIPNWSKHQCLDQLEEKKKYQRNYMKKYREKQRQITDSNYSKSNCKTNSKANVSSLDKEEDKEKDIEIDKRKNIKKEKCSFNYSDLLDLSLHELFKEYLDLRQSLKVKNTDRAVNLLITELKKYPLNEQKQMLENSIMHSWKSVYPIKKVNANNQKNDKDLPAVNAIFDDSWQMNDEEFEEFRLKNIRETFGEKFYKEFLEEMKETDEEAEGGKANG